MDADAYEFRVLAKNDRRVNVDSDQVIVMDTPIYRADGDSRTKVTPTVEIEWSIPASLPAVANNTYHVRYRRWPMEESADGTLQWAPWEVEEVQGVKGTINDGLALNQVYTIQFYYETVSETRVYAARYAWAWPSKRAAGGGERVVSFPLNRPISSREYSYRICKHTFPEAAPPDTDSTRDAWEKLIEHALEQWELATRGLVRMTYEGECTGYSEFSESIAAAVKRAVPSSGNGEEEERQIEEHVDEFLDNLNLMGLQGVGVVHNPARSEVLMLGGGTAALFAEVGNGVIHWGCRGRMCAPPDIKHGTTDIVVMGNASYDGRPRNTLTEDDLGDLPGDDTIPSEDDVRFNSCEVASFGPKGNLVYEDIVHEGGHTLGIREGGGEGELAHHSSRGHDSVMNYDFREPDCSPHPLDIMAIYALYQTLKPLDEQE